jgi:O-methyltransferase involved in polyketide biosynthesis
MPVLYGVEFEAAVNLKDIIGGSSQVVAACRASESERVDALFVDPLAK